MAEPLDFTDVPQEPAPEPGMPPDDLAFALAPTQGTLEVGQTISAPDSPLDGMVIKLVPEPEPLILLPALRIINRRANIAQQLEILSIDPQDDGSFLVFTADPH